MMLRNFMSIKFETEFIITKQQTYWLQVMENKYKKHCCWCNFSCKNPLIHDLQSSLLLICPKVSIFGLSSWLGIQPIDNWFAVYFITFLSKILYIWCWVLDLEFNLMITDLQPNLLFICPAVCFQLELYFLTAIICKLKMVFISLNCCTFKFYTSLNFQFYRFVLIFTVFIAE